MPLTSGTRLGPYEVVAAIGAGGMGEVYRARDTTLHRDVAIKVLPQSARDTTSRRAVGERTTDVNEPPPVWQKIGPRGEFGRIVSHPFGRAARRQHPLDASGTGPSASPARRRHH